MRKLNEEQSKQLDDIFTYHPATDEDLEAYAAINTASKVLARTILEHCPGSADRTAAVRLVREARMTANASVACKGRSMPDGC